MSGWTSSPVVKTTSRALQRSRLVGDARAMTRSSASSTGSSTLPVFHLPKPEASDTEHRSFASSLVRTCHEIGFFYLCDHGAELSAEGVLEASKEFFARPLEEKLEICYTKSPSFRGYMYEGCENTAGRTDKREQIEFGVEGLYDRDAAVFYERLVGPNQFPRDSTLREEVNEFHRRMDALSRRVMSYIALGLGLEQDYFESTFGDVPNVQMKICRYPPTGSSDEFGVGEHSDTGYLSLLVQDKDVAGLQVKVNDTWIDAPPIAGSLVVNLGEMLQLCTQGYLLATPHRVRNTAASRSRYSIPYFWNPRLDYSVELIDLPDELVWRRPAESRSFRSTGSHEGRNQVYECYGANAFKSYARSHPKVMEAHHSDLNLEDLFS
jgi:isopenicillin N synthase-like dioxygenase